MAEAALRRAAALAAGDEAGLRLLMHPGLQWTSLRGEVLGYEDYIVGNTRGGLRWRSQRLDGVTVVVAGDTAVLTAAVTDEVSRDGRDQVRAHAVITDREPLQFAGRIVAAWNSLMTLRRAAA